MPSTEAQAQESPSEWPTVALVIEASLSVAQEWKTYLHSLGLILRRLIYAAHSIDKVNIAVIVYGSSYTLPSPILCKRYFDTVQLVFSQLAKGLTGLGVGSLSAGRNQGMAALDGLVAALELFDHHQLTAKSARPPKLFSHHLIHITSSGPDASRNPSWNDRAARDNLSWETLPDALKESRVQYTVFSTRGLSPRYQTLYENLNKEKPVPQWLTVKSPGSVLLALFPEEPPKPPGDIQKTPAQPTESPKPPTPAASQPDVPAQDAPSSSAPIREPARGKAQDLGRKKGRLPPRTSLPKAGANVEEFEGVGGESIQSQATPYTLPAYLPQEKGHHSEIEPPPAEESVQPSGRKMGRQPPLVPPPFSLGAASSSSSMSNLSALQQNLSPAAPPARSVSDQPAHPQISNINPMLGPAQMNQYQKLMKERSERSWPPIAGGGMPVPVPHMGAGAPPRPIMSGMLNQDHHMPNAFSAQIPAVQQHERPPSTSNKAIQVWDGTLNFKGTANGSTQELCVYVTASTGVPTLARPDTWPEDMHLAPTPQSDISLSEIREWITTSYAAWVTFIARQYGAPEHSEYAFNALVQLLTTKKMFATAAWTTPTGGQTSNMFIFPVNSTHLVGACFPMTGIPDLPGKIPYPYPPENPSLARANQCLHYTLANLSQEQRQLLEKMPPNQRGPALQALAKKNEMERTRTIQHLQQGQRHSQQMAGGSSSLGPGNNALAANYRNDFPPSGMPMNAVGMSTGISRMVNISGPMQHPGGGGERAATGGMPANMNFMAVYQSFNPRGDGGSRAEGA